jgi:hypothetical protein
MWRFSVLRLLPYLTDQKFLVCFLGGKPLAILRRGKKVSLEILNVRLERERRETIVIFFSLLILAMVAWNEKWIVKQALEYFHIYRLVT